jgi:hypothetical protein
MRTLCKFSLGLPLLLLPLLAGKAQDKPTPAPAAAKESKALAPKKLTLENDSILLSKALAELTRQTGNEVQDRRQAKEDMLLKLHFKDDTFWEALDAIAKAADARVSVFQKDGVVALVDGPFQVLPVSYDGLFRVTLKRIAITHVLEADTRMCQFSLEVAWEPRFQAAFIDSQATDLEAEDDKGRTVEVPAPSPGQSSVNRRNAVEIQVRTAAPLRSAASLKVLKGKFTITGPSETLTFAFDKLAKIDKKADQRTKTQKGVSVTLQELRSEGGEGDRIWTVGLLLEYPANGPKFESFQSWLAGTEIHLVRDQNGKKQQLAPNLGYETDDQSENKAIIRYRFGDEPDKNISLGAFADWTLLYKTPGGMLVLPVPFEFKDVQLP